MDFRAHIQVSKETNRNRTCEVSVVRRVNFILRVLHKWIFFVRLRTFAISCEKNDEKKMLDKKDEIRERNMQNLILISEVALTLRSVHHRRFILFTPIARLYDAID